MGKMDNAGKLPLPEGRGGGDITAAAVRQRIQLVVSKAPVVMVKLTGSSRSMGAVRGHLRYLTERGEMLRDDDGREYCTPAEVKDFGDQFRYAGPPIPTEDGPRQAFHLAIGMPAGTDPHRMTEAVEAFARREFEGHRWAWAFHSHQSQPHAHLIVRALGWRAQRLDPRKTDLHRWRESFAQELRARGIQADASSRLVRGSLRQTEPAWVVRARNTGTLRQEAALKGRVTTREQTMRQVITAWAHLHAALAESPDAADWALAVEVKDFVKSTPMLGHVVGLEVERQQEQQRQPVAQPNMHQEPGPGW